MPGSWVRTPSLWGSKISTTNLPYSVSMLINVQDFEKYRAVLAALGTNFPLLIIPLYMVK